MAAATAEQFTGSSDDKARKRKREAFDVVSRKAPCSSSTSSVAASRSQPLGSAEEEADDPARKAWEHMSDHKPGRATATSCSERSGIRVCCEDCGSASAPGRMGPPRTCYAGTFKCNACWDSEDEAVRVEKDRISKAVPAPFTYVLLGVDRSTPQRCRLRKRNENGMWKIQFKDKKEVDDIPGENLKLDIKDRVESLQELKTILGQIFEKLPPDSPGSPRRVRMSFLPTAIHRQFGRCLHPKALGHKKLSLLMEDAEVTEKFIVKDSYICEAQPHKYEGLSCRIGE